MNIRKIFIVLAGCLLLLTCNTLSAFAETALPDGAVKGLPERLAALDNEGNAVNSATGEYFFRVEDMKYGEEYTKIVQLMNLREDESYHIYFCVEPLFKKGEIDLEEGCTCTFWLDGNEIYKGTVTGEPEDGSRNLQGRINYFDCGYYNPGDTHRLKCSVVWDNLDVLKNVSNGHKLVDKDGTHVLVGPDEEGYVEGEIEFKWIFYASVHPLDLGYDDDKNTNTTEPTDVRDANDTVTTAVSDGTNSDSGSNSGGLTDSDSDSGSDSDSYYDSGGFTNTPFTGYFARNGKPWLIAIGVISAMIVIMLILIHKDKRRKTKKK